MTDFEAIIGNNPVIFALFDIGLSFFSYIIGLFPNFTSLNDIMHFLSVIQNFEEEPIPQQLLLPYLKNYKRPHDKIHELVKKGELTAIKNGLFVPGPKLKMIQPAAMLLANHILGPSYVSLETALSYWGLIPERVYETSSATIKRSRRYKTPAGRFTYHHLPLPYYAFDIQSVQLTPRQTVLIASREKAVCDKIILTSGLRFRSTRQALDFLIEDMRMDEEALKQLSTSKIKTWITDSPKAASIQQLIKAIHSL